MKIAKFILVIALTIVMGIGINLTSLAEHGHLLSVGWPQATTAETGNTCINPGAPPPDSGFPLNYRQYGCIEPGKQINLLAASLNWVTYLALSLAIVFADGMLNRRIRKH
jgi:hypothetical protein